MDPLDDYPITRTPEEQETPSKRPLWPILALTLVAVAAIVWWLLWRRPPPQEADRATEPTATSGPLRRAPLGPEVAPIDLPPLNLTDPVVRELLGALSSRPEVARWLAGDDLVRNFVVSVDNVASGTTPARHLRRLAPEGRFQVVEDNGRIFVDERSFRRYDGLADTVASLDAAGLARLYSTLKPRLDEAYRELGHPEGNFDGAVEQAIVRLLRTPETTNRIELRTASVSYQFADPELESLSSAQKQLIRMGPRNARLVKDKLRELARALNIPEERLPPGPPVT